MREGCSKILCLANRWNRIHGQAKNCTLRSETRKSAIRSHEQHQDRGFWAFKHMEK